MCNVARDRWPVGLVSTRLDRLMAKVETCVEKMNPRDQSQKQKSIRCIRDQMRNLHRTIAIVDLLEGTHNCICISLSNCFFFSWREGKLS